MADIHPTAIIEDGAEVDGSAVIGPYCLVGGGVRIGAGTRLMSHVHIEGDTHIGRDCTIFPFASIGTQTQDLKYRGGTPGVRIGNGTTLREYVTVNAATEDGDLTVVGDGGHIMAYAHIAHDCRVGDGVIMANCATLGGHVTLEEGAIVGGLCGVHQFVRIGRAGIIGGCSKVTQDIPPYMMADGHPARVRSLNRVGLQRRGTSEEVLAALKSAYRVLFRSGKTLEEAIRQIETEGAEIEECRVLVDFLRSAERGVAR